MGTKNVLPKREDKVVKQFFDHVGTARLDSTGADTVLKEGGVSIPETVGRVLENINEKAHGAFLDSVALASERYKMEHGIDVPGDVLEAAMYRAHLATFDDASVMKGELKLLDSASSAHGDPAGLQPNRAVVAVISTIAEALPVAGYLPTDIGSNEARLAILSHQAGSTMGQYTNGDNIDGVNSGGMYLASERIIQLTGAAAGGTGPFTATASKHFTGYVPDAVDANNPLTPLQRGVSMVFVNGMRAASEVGGSSGSGASALGGSITIAGTTYVISGSVNTDTGAVSVSSAPALPANTNLYVQVAIDFEKAPALAPIVGVGVDVFKLYARPSRGLMQASIDVKTQLSNELGLDGPGQALIALQNHFTIERHRRALFKLRAIGAQFSDTFDFQWAARSAQLVRAQMMYDLGAVVTLASQKMVNRTFGTGIRVIYVSAFMASIFMSLSSEVFTPSGVPPGAGIRRVGRWLNMYDIYYSPWEISEAANRTSSELLCVGRSDDTARNAIQMGDAVAPMYLPLAFNSDMVYGAGYYHRGFNEVSPYAPGAQSVCIINITNLS